MHKYGKRNGKRQKKREFLLAGPGGFSAQPSVGARVRAGGLAGPPVGDGSVGAGPRASEDGSGQR
jgi:hypothetical protein